ncbi:DMT family transporter [Thalassospiraceae bacterium LMO-SO8]|nr:DMT family transporter [Alphaproteobacteria bacterium LMO-S08]WND75151.1 DMT family transporter [Thalassospiraceae bacterium LMO-SO8]
MDSDQPKSSVSRISTLQILVVMVLWASCFPLITAGIGFSPHLTFAALRAVIAGAALMILAAALRRPLPDTGRDWAIITFIGLGATSLGFLGMFHAAEFVTPGVATVIANTQPLMAAFLAALMLGETVSFRGKLGLLLGFVGIVVIAVPQFFSTGGETYALGIAYILLAAFGITISNVLIKKIAGKIDVLMAMGLQTLIGSVPLAAAAWSLEDPWKVQWTPSFVASLLGLSIFGTALAYYLWFSALEHIPLNRANAFAFLVPVFGILLGMTFFDEPFGWAHFIGIPLTIVGVTLVNKSGDSVSLNKDQATSSSAN